MIINNSMYLNYLNTLQNPSNDVNAADDDDDSTTAANSSANTPVTLPANMDSVDISGTTEVEEVEAEIYTTTGTITQLYQATQNGTTQFFFILDGDENLYISPITNNSRQVQMSVGSNVSIEYYNSPDEELVGIVSKIEIS